VLVAVVPVLPSRCVCRLATLAAVAAVAVIVGVRVPAAAAAEPPGPIISVAGSHLLRDGLPWTPRGVQIVGLVAPDAALWGKYVAAHAHFGAAELQAAVADHADLVRFQVSEFGIDPAGALYSPAYVQEVQAGVQAARSLGLAVIVSLQAEAPAGEPERCPLPDAGGQRAWEQLAAMFAGDPGVMFELYNEPAVAATAAGWSAWLNGGDLAYPGGTCQAVGMQPLVDDIRTLAPQNVIILPGAAGEQSLRGMPQVSDPTNPQNPQLVLGVHYPALTRGVSAWDTAFARAAAAAPVIVTEWDANGTTNCLPDAPRDAQLLLDYLVSRQVGVVGFAFDLPGTIVTDWSGTPTTYTGFTCGMAAGGPGQLLFSQYAAEAQAGDGTQPDPAPAWIISAGLLRRLAAVAPKVAAHFFNTPRTFVTGTGAPGLAALGAPTAIPAESFADETKLAAAVTSGRLRPGTTAVIYDPAQTRATPRPQQRNPARYTQVAGAAVHASGLLFVAAPALSLATAIAPGTKPAQQQRVFLRLGVARGAARAADVYAAPAAAPRQSAFGYTPFVAAAAAQAAQAHPGVEVLAGMNAGAQGAHMPRAQLLDTFLGTRSTVNGYVLADAAPGALPDQGLAFLRALSRLDG
jgi:Cellulase (glycosyl hydrolase family 5)